MIRHVCSGCGAVFHTTDAFTRHCETSHECADRICREYGHHWIVQYGQRFCEICLLVDRPAAHATT